MLIQAFITHKQLHLLSAKWYHFQPVSWYIIQPVHTNSTSNCNTYGRLYDWNTALTLAPLGWHLPSDAEWSTLTTFLGTDSAAGAAMKSVTGWTPPNAGASNSSGFTALPGGYRYDDGTFFQPGLNGVWWSSTPTPTQIGIVYAYARQLNYYISNVSRFYDSKTQGFSVRCIRN